MNGKKCPNCGACQECGHAPNRGAWVTPIYPGTNPYPYWSVIPPYTTGDFPNWNTSATFTSNSSGAWQ